MLYRLADLLHETDKDDSLNVVRLHGVAIRSAPATI